MKVAIVLFALVAVAAADYGKPVVSWAHAPNYKVDWAVADDYGNDYAQTETRSGDNTETKWRVVLPGKGSHIKRDDVIHAQQHVSTVYAAPAAPVYAAPAAYKAPAPAYKPTY